MFISCDSLTYRNTIYCTQLDKHQDDYAKKEFILLKKNHCKKKRFYTSKHNYYYEKICKNENIKKEGNKIYCDETPALKEWVKARCKEKYDEEYCNKDTMDKILDYYYRDMCEEGYGVFCKKQKELNYKNNKN
jgi:hypothetical protein